MTGLFALALGAFAGSANADPAYPPKAGCTVSTTTTDAGPGQSVTFVGSGFAGNQTVALSTPSGSLGTVTTTGGGSFSGTFTLPASTGASTTVQASAPSSTCSFTLIDSQSGVGNAGGSRGNAGSSGSGSGGGSGLASTGFETLTATTIALAFLGAGAIFLGLARRKRV